MSEPEVIVERRGLAGFITLNRPSALNALNLGMTRRIAGALDDWERDGRVARIVVTGAGERAFCAGGDIRLLWELGRAGDHQAQLTLWREEYQLNRRIKRYPKPVVALVDGLAMGGGVGLSAHGSHCLASENFVFAMPEVGIGFFPDVGTTWLLPRLARRIGVYLAVTGARANAGDAVALGLAQAMVARANFGELAMALETSEPTDAIVARLAAPSLPSPLMQEAALIERCFGAAHCLDIAGALAQAGEDGSAFANAALAAMRAKSPTSQAIALRQMQLGGALTFEQTLRMEFRIVARICRGHDFYEGVRAAIIDKDRQPRWRPARAEDLQDAAIDAYFAPLGAADGVEELDFAGMKS